jgi:hypothetical protein
MGVLTLTPQEIADLTENDVASLAKRLEIDDYNSPFEALKDWHLLRAIAFQKYELVEVFTSDYYKLFY